MIRIDLTQEEQTTLRDILESALSDLRMEIADTDNHDFKEMLKRRKGILEKTIAALSAPAGENG